MPTWGARLAACLCGPLVLGLPFLSPLWPARARAEESPVPVAVQAQMLVRVAAYDRSLPARARAAGGPVRVLILTRPEEADSRMAAAQMEATLRATPAIAGAPHVEITHAYAGADALAEECRRDRVAIVYVTPGLEADVPAMASALSGSDVLTVTGIARYVPAGIVLGFDLSSGKARLIINLAQARRQNVDMKSEVLRLMKVYS